MQRGAFGPLTSVVPPITVPAWIVHDVEPDPGYLGIYGFRNRADHSYDGLGIANGNAVKEPRLWDSRNPRRQGVDRARASPGHTRRGR